MTTTSTTTYTTTTAFDVSLTTAGAACNVWDRWLQFVANPVGTNDLLNYLVTAQTAAEENPQWTNCGPGRSHLPILWWGRQCCGRRLCGYNHHLLAGTPSRADDATNPTRQFRCPVGLYFILKRETAQERPDQFPPSALQRDLDAMLGYADTAAQASSQWTAFDQAASTVDHGGLGATGAVAVIGSTCNAVL